MPFYKKVNISPPRLLVLVFLVAIIIGTLLLKLPFATTESISWLDALFTATSAMTVTGLVVVDTGQAFTTFGEVIIACLIQVGGLGIMTFAVLIFMALGRKIGFKERLLIQQALNQSSVGGVIFLAQRLLIYSLVIETIAFILLTLRWGPELGWKEGLYASFFHSISAFNNAGFSIWADSLSGYVGDPVVNIVITLLFIIGGIGFTVLLDIWRGRKKLSLHSRLMLWGTLIINIFSMIIIFLIEYDNPNTLQNLSLSDKLWATYFQAVTPRTAGFNTIDIGSMDEPSLFFMLFLMFIGAGSGSTGGGIKLTTFLAIAASVITFVKGEEDIVVLKRTIAQRTIIRSLAIAMIGMTFIFLATLLLEIVEGKRFLDVLFEVVSAFGTVGLSTGLTGGLTSIGKVIIIVVMMVGKLGPLTLAFSFATTKRANIRYPQEEILTG